MNKLMFSNNIVPPRFDTEKAFPYVADIEVNVSRLTRSSVLDIFGPRERATSVAPYVSVYSRRI